MARRMQLAKGVDPSLALYAAYAYDQLQRRDLILQMQSYLRDDTHLGLFDIALLSRGLEGQRAGTATGVYPFLPLLAQGWALLPAHRVRLPPRLSDVRRHLLPSLWTLFDARGTSMIREAMASREVR
jgi:hypothetical protein